MKEIILLMLLWLPLVRAQAQDLAVYEARGSVKRIQWAKDYGYAYPIPFFYGKRDFDRRGRDKGFAQRYYAQRDKRGRMKREGMDPTDAYYWHYDKKGRVTWCYYLQRGDTEFFDYIIYYFYAANGEVGKYRIHRGAPSEIGAVIDELTIHIIERDRYGNWTKRQFTSNISNQIYKEERTITYYR